MPATLTDFDTSPKPVTRTAGTHAVLANEDIIVVDASGGAVVLNLHTAAQPFRWRNLIIKRIDAHATNTVTINGTGGDLIDGAASLVIPGNSQWVAYTLANDQSSNWYIV